jgi:hypothetical protein
MKMAKAPDDMLAGCWEAFRRLLGVRMYGKNEQTLAEAAFFCGVEAALSSIEGAETAGGDDYAADMREALRGELDRFFAEKAAGTLIGMAKGRA